MRGSTTVNVWFPEAIRTDLEPINQNYEDRSRAAAAQILLINVFLLTYMTSPISLYVFFLE